MNLFKKSVAMLIAMSVSLTPLQINAKNIMEMEQVQSNFLKQLQTQFQTLITVDIS